MLLNGAMCWQHGDTDALLAQVQLAPSGGKDELLNPPSSFQRGNVFCLLLVDLQLMDCLY